MSRYPSGLYHHNFSNLLPLLLGGICTSWIVGTCVQNKDGVLWTALGGNREKTKCSKLPVVPSSVGVSILQSLPPGHRGNRPGRGPSSLRPSTCKDGRPQSQHWQIQHCDFLKQTERKRLGAVFIAHIALRRILFSWVFLKYLNR